MTSAIGTVEIGSARNLSSYDAPSRGRLDGATELAYREGAGIEVVLWWSRATGELKVSVHEHASGSSFDIPAGETNALEIFNHPYAYARPD